MNWRMTIDVSAEWAELTDVNNSIPKFREAKRKLLIRLRGHKRVIQIDIGIQEFYQYVGILNGLSTSKTIENFDKHWNRLYNWCDRNRIWLQTVKV